MNEGSELDALKAKYIELQMKQVDANRRMDINTYDMPHDWVWDAMLAIESFAPGGRQAMEDYLRRPEPTVRFRAAVRVIEWDPYAAVPVLGRLLTDEFPPDLDGYHRFSVITDASMFLHKHFDLPWFDRTELIEPPRRYRYELPRSYLD